MMARAKRIYILMIKVEQVDFLFCNAVFSKRNRKHVLGLSNYRNTRESLGELKKDVETLACGSCSHSISPFPKLSLKIVENTVPVFYFLTAICTYLVITLPFCLHTSNFHHDVVRIITKAQSLYCYHGSTLETTTGRRYVMNL